MSLTGAPPSTRGLLARVQNILLRPKAEWDVIAGETASAQGLILGYAAIVSALPALARIVNGFMPHCFFGAICVTPNPVSVVVSAVVYYLATLAAVFLVGLMIDVLAPSFGGVRNQIQAVKVAVYSCTAAWLAGVFIVVPWIGGLLSLLGFYSLYLLYAGLPPLMKAPQDKALGYTAVVVVLGLVIFIVIGVIAGSVAAVGALNGGAFGSVNVKGANVDVGKLQSTVRQLESEYGPGGAGGGQTKITPIDPDKLKTLLPDNVNGAPRTDISVASGSAAGIGGSNVEATYQRGDARVTLMVTDLAAAGGFAAMAGALNVQSNHETATGYEKVATINGRLTTEKYDNSDKSGEYSVIVANRFNISAEGSGVSMDVLKGAVAAVGPDRLEGLAHG